MAPTRAQISRLMPRLWRAGRLYVIAYPQPALVPFEPSAGVRRPERLATALRLHPKPGLLMLPSEHREFWRRALRGGRWTARPRRRNFRSAQKREIAVLLLYAQSTVALRCAAAAYSADRCRR
jgi:hypothetical protein